VCGQSLVVLLQILGGGQASLQRHFYPREPETIPGTVVCAEPVSGNRHPHSNPPGLMGWGGAEGKGSASSGDQGWDCVCGKPNSKGNWWSKTQCRACAMPVQQALNQAKAQNKGGGKGATKYQQDSGKSSAEDAATLNFRKEIARMESTEKTMRDFGWKDSQLLPLREKIKELKLAANGGVEQTREELAAGMLQKRIHHYTTKRKLKSLIRENSVQLRDLYMQLQKAAENLDGITQELRLTGWDCKDMPSEDEGPDELQEMLERQHWQGANVVKGTHMYATGKGYEEDGEDWHSWWQRDVAMAQEEHGGLVDWEVQPEDGAEG
jgi:hypothetical protein